MRVSSTAACIARYRYIVHASALQFGGCALHRRDSVGRASESAGLWGAVLIMEALGGDRKWQDRFLGQHAAIFYYWALVVCFLISPKWSYKFSEMLESAPLRVPPPALHGHRAPCTTCTHTCVGSAGMLGRTPG